MDKLEHASDALLLDQVYDADAIRLELAAWDIKAVIPKTIKPPCDDPRDCALDKQRNRFGRLKINRTIATGYDQLAETFLGREHIAKATYRLKSLHAA